MNTKTKTFPPESDLGDLIDWFVKQIETEDIEVPYSGAEPSLDIVSITKKKYTITVKSTLAAANGHKLE